MSFIRPVKFNSKNFPLIELNVFKEKSVSATELERQAGGSTMKRFIKESTSCSWTTQDTDSWTTQDTEASIDALALEKEADEAMLTADRPFLDSNERRKFFLKAAEKYAKAARALEKAGDYDHALVLQIKSGIVFAEKLMLVDKALDSLEKTAAFYQSIGRGDLASQLYLSAMAICDRFIVEKREELETESDLFYPEWYEMKIAEMTIRKAQILEKMGAEEAVYRKLYKEAGDSLMQLDVVCFNDTITSYTLASLCFEKAGLDPVQIQQGYQKYIDLVRPCLDEFATTISDAIALFAEKKEVDSDYSGEMAASFFMIFRYSKLAREAQFCAAKLGDRDFCLSIIERERALYELFFQNNLSLAGLHKQASSIDPIGTLFCAQYLSLTEFLSSVYTATDPEKAASLQRSADEFKETLMQRFNRKDFLSALPFYTDQLKKNLEQRLSSDEKSMGEYLELFSIFAD